MNPDEREVLESFLGAHGIVIPSHARNAKLGRLFHKHFQSIADMANPCREPWTGGRLSSLAKVVSDLDPADFRPALESQIIPLPVAEYATNPTYLKPVDGGKLLQLIRMTIPVKLRRKVLSEVQLWRATQAAFDLRREAEESFEEAIERCTGTILSMRSSERRSRRKRVTAKVILNHDVAPSSRPAAPEAASASATKRPSRTAKEAFYASWDWRTLRMEVLREHGTRCQCCGAAPGMLDEGGMPVQIVVDHIKPLSKCWDLRLEKTNLQVLCSACNQGKGAWDETDYRPQPIQSPPGTPHQIP